MATFNPDWLLPNWPAPARVRAVFTSRAGGFSQAPFDSLNLGAHVGDLPAHVAQNRQALQSALGATPIFLNQVHGQEVLEISSNSAQGQAADASVTTQAGVACTVMVADCLPVLFAHLDAPVVAAAHAGWRGLAGVLPSVLPSVLPGQAPSSVEGPGILAVTFQRFAAAVSAASGAALSPHAVAARTLAWLGPCIGPAAFEVGADVRAAFMATEPGSQACFAASPGNQAGVAASPGNQAGVAASPGSKDKYGADLPALARLRLAALGVTQVYGNDGSASWCTVSQASRFFSHRRSGTVGANRGTVVGVGVGVGGTGRMAACIWLA